MRFDEVEEKKKEEKRKKKERNNFERNGKRFEAGAIAKAHARVPTTFECDIGR